MNKKTIVAEIALLLITIIWGMAFIFQDMGMEHLEPFSFCVARSIIGSSFLLLLSLTLFGFRKLRKQQINPNGYKLKDLIVYGLLIGVFTAAGLAFQQVGIKFEGAGKSGFITSLYIVVVPIVGLFFGKKVNFMVPIALMLGICGLYLINITDGELSFGAGTWALIGCAISYGIQIVLISMFSAKCDAILLTAVQFIFSAMLITPLMLIFETPIMDNFVKAIWGLLFCGVLSTGIAFTIQVWAQKFVPVFAASMIMSLESVFSIIFAATILHEQYGGLQILGCILIFVAVILSQLDFKKPQKQQSNV